MLRTLSKVFLAAVAATAMPALALACPFCSGVSLTLSEEMKTATAAVVGKLVSLPPPPAEGATLTGADSKAVFEIVTAAAVRSEVSSRTLRWLQGGRHEILASA